MHPRKSSCRLLGLPRAAIRELTSRAVLQTPPFRNANKGFKDELLVLSMLKLVKRGWNYRTYVLVTKGNDVDVGSLAKRFAALNVAFEREACTDNIKENRS
jgi:hypothetical protein